jgi:hypothetical protein
MAALGSVPDALDEIWCRPIPVGGPYAFVKSVPDYP